MAVPLLYITGASQNIFPAAALKSRWYHRLSELLPHNWKPTTSPAQA
jgi:hypothetical protein